MVIYSVRRVIPVSTRSQWCPNVHVVGVWRSRAKRRGCRFCQHPIIAAVAFLSRWDVVTTTTCLRWLCQRRCWKPACARFGGQLPSDWLHEDISRERSNHPAFSYKVTLSLLVLKLTDWGWLRLAEIDWLRLTDWGWLTEIGWGCLNEVIWLRLSDWG